MSTAFLARVGPILLSAALLLAAPLRAQQSPPDSAPTLLVFQHTEGDETYAIPILAKAGPTPSPLAGKLLNKLVITPGDALTLVAQPVDILVELYRGGGTGGELQCSIRIRYYRGQDGTFVPHYQLYHEPNVFRGPGGRWIPIEPLCNSPSSVKLSSTAEANADGFYPALEFSLLQGPLQVDSWVVR